MRPWARNVDLLLVALVGGLCLASRAVAFADVLRAPAAALLVLYLPGYALSRALFVGGLTTVERIVHSLGLSLALSALVGLGLYVSGAGLRACPGRAGGMVAPLRHRRRGLAAH